MAPYGVIYLLVAEYWGMRKVAIFDVDGTIFRSSLLIELVDIMIERKIFSPDVVVEYQVQKVKWLDRKGDYESYIMAVVKAFMKNLKGVPFSEFEDACREVVSRYSDRTYRFTRDLLKQLKKDGYFLLAISHSPKGVLDQFCPTLGFDKSYGMFYELGPSDRFTGKIIDEHLIKNKSAILKRAIVKEKLTLVGSIGVGDTESDISFLELVERPICFNPNEKLYKEAKRNGWDVIVERKDMIYNIKQ